MSTVNPAQPKRPTRRRSVLQRLVGDDTQSIVKRHTAKVELEILQRNENAAQNDGNDGTPSKILLSNRANEAATLISASGVHEKIAVNKTTYETKIQLNQQRIAREKEIQTIEQQLRKKMISKKKRKSLEEQRDRAKEEVKEVVRRLSIASHDSTSESARSGGMMPQRRISNTEKDHGGGLGSGGLTTSETEREKARIKSQIHRASSIGSSSAGGGGGRPRRRISMTENTMVIETVIDDANDGHHSADNAAGPDYSSRSSPFDLLQRIASSMTGSQSERSLSNKDVTDTSRRMSVDSSFSNFIYLDEEEHAMTQEEKVLRDAMDAIVKARIKAGRPMRRMSSTEQIVLSNESERSSSSWLVGGSISDREGGLLGDGINATEFYMPKGSKMSDDDGGTIEKEVKEHEEEEEEKSNLDFFNHRRLSVASSIGIGSARALCAHDNGDDDDHSCGNDDDDDDVEAKRPSVGDDDVIVVTTVPIKTANLKMDSNDRSSKSSGSTDTEMLNDGPFAQRRPSYNSSVLDEPDKQLDISDASEKQSTVEGPKRKSILKKAPYRPERRGSGIHSDEFEQWNPKVSALSRKLYELQQESDAREESMKNMSYQMELKDDENEEHIRKLMSHIRQLNKDNKETPLQLRYWQEKATTLSKKVYDLELLLEEQDESINELLEFKEIQAERIKTLEEEVLKNRMETFEQLVEDENGSTKKKSAKSPRRLSRRASVDMTLKKSLRRASSSSQSFGEQVKEETKLEIFALESRLAKVNDEQAELQRELESMRALLQSTQEEPKVEEKVIVNEKQVTRERLIYQLSCRQCKGKNLNFVGTTMMDIMEQMDIHFNEVAQQVQKMNGKGRRSDAVFTEGTNSTKWSASFAQHFAKHCRKKCKTHKDVIKYCKKNVKIEVLKKESGAALFWNDYDE